MVAQETQLDTISNNLANANTAGYKRQNAEFEDLLYQNVRTAALTATGSSAPTGTQVGSGARVVATSRSFSQGPMQQTGNPLDIAIEDGAKEILAISLMGGGEYEAAPHSLPELMARTLQLTLHHQMLSDYERLRDRARIVVLCPVTAPTATWEMKREHIEAVIESSRKATADLLAVRGSKALRHSGIHYLDLRSGPKPGH